MFFFLNSCLLVFFASSCFYRQCKCIVAFSLNAIDRIVLCSIWLCTESNSNCLQIKYMFHFRTNRGNCVISWRMCSMLSMSLKSFLLCLHEMTSIFVSFSFKKAMSHYYNSVEFVARKTFRWFKNFDYLVARFSNSRHFI